MDVSSPAPDTSGVMVAKEIVRGSVASATLSATLKTNAELVSRDSKSILRTE